MKIELTANDIAYVLIEKVRELNGRAENSFERTIPGQPQRLRNAALELQHIAALLNL